MIVFENRAELDEQRQSAVIHLSDQGIELCQGLPAQIRHADLITIKEVLEIQLQHVRDIRQSQEVGRGLAAFDVGDCLKCFVDLVTIRFDPVVNLTRDAGRLIKNMVVQTAHLAEEAALFSGQNAAQDLWAETDLVSTLLSCQNSNISHMIASADHGALPSQIRLATAFIHANLSEPIRLADIAHHGGMNVRTLQKGFQRYFQQSPMQVLRDARLDTAHYHLTVRRDAPSVTDVAYSNGFSHLGRFSRDYKNRFGHLPSQIH